jgi:hypothetical protein
MKSKNARIFRPLVQVGMGEDPEAADKARLRINDAHDILFRIADLARQQAQPKPDWIANRSPRTLLLRQAISQSGAIARSQRAGVMFSIVRIRSTDGR